MTPEQPSAPETQENTTPTNKGIEETGAEGVFVIPEQVPHGGEGVIDDFDGTPLDVAAPELEKRGVPNDASAIDTDTLAVPYTPLEKFTVPSTTETEPKRGRRGIAAGIAAVTGLVAVTAGAMFMRSGDDTSATPEKKPVASASPNPGETSEPNESEAPKPETKSAEQLVGTIVADDFDNLNAKPNQDVISKVDEPILVTDFSAEQAAIQIGKKLKVFYLSGESDFDTPSEVHLQTQASILAGNQLLSEVFASTVDVDNSGALEWMKNTRTDTAFRLNYYGTTEQYNLETSKPEYATSATTWEVVSSEGNTVTIEAHQYTNFEALDRSDILDDNSGIDTNQVFSLKATLAQEDGEWRLVTLTPVA